MSLVGFRAKNHPQQVGKAGAKDTVDERITPQWLFDQENAIHNFTVDAAANAANAKLPMFWDLAADGLTQSWGGHRVWCNPPYSNIPGWVKKASDEAVAGCPCVVMLLPANRTEQRWWQDLIEPRRDRPGSGVTVRFLARRINFGTPGNPAGKYVSSSPFGLCIITFKEG